MTALLIRRRRPVGEPDDLDAAPIATFEGPAGAGRILLALAELELPLDGPWAVRQLVVDPSVSTDELQDVDAGLYGLTILGSHLVNLPEPDARRAFLAFATRHLGPGGTLLVEHHPIDWAETADEVRATPGGSRIGMEEVRRDPPFVSAVSVYDHRGHEMRQPFTARVLSEAELAQELAAVGLHALPRRAPTWLLAVHASASAGTRA